MITRQEKEHEISTDAKAEVLQLLHDALKDPNFKGFSVWLGHIVDFSIAFTNIPNKAYKVNIKTECNQ